MPTHNRQPAVNPPSQAIALRMLAEAGAGTKQIMAVLGLTSLALAELIRATRSRSTSLRAG